MSKYTPPTSVFVKDLSQETLSQHEFDSIVVVSTDLNSLPNFPGYETLKSNKEVDQEILKSICLNVSNEAPGKRLVSAPSKANIKIYSETVAGGIERARRAGSVRPLVLLHNLPSSDDSSYSIEKVIQSIYGSIRPEEKKKEKKGIIKKVAHKKKDEDDISSPRNKSRVASKPKAVDIDNDEPNTIRLWHIPGSPSSRILWLLKELGGQYIDNLEISLVNKDTKGAFVSINPSHTVPTIRFGKGGIILWDSGAIISYILSKEKSLYPTTWTKENWVRHNMYAYWTTATLDQKVVKKKMIWKTFERKVCEDLGENEYINGNEFSATDIYVAYTLHLVHEAGLMKSSPKPLQDYFQRISQREAFTFSLQPDPQSTPQSAPQPTQSESNTEQQENTEPKHDLSIPINNDEGIKEEEDESETKSPRSPRQAEEVKHISLIGFHVFDDKSDYTLLGKTLHTIETALVNAGSSYNKMSNYEFAKLTFTTLYGPLVVSSPEPEEIVDEKVENEETQSSSN